MFKGGESTGLPWWIYPGYKAIKRIGQWGQPANPWRYRNRGPQIGDKPTYKRRRPDPRYPYKPPARPNPERMRPRKKPKKKSRRRKKPDETKSRKDKFPRRTMGRSGMRKRVLRKKKSTLKRLARQLSLLNSPPVRFVHSAAEQIEGNVNDAAYHSMCDSVGTLIHGSRAQYNQIYNYVNALASGTTFEDSATKMFVQSLTTRYRFLNPGNQRLVLDIYEVTPRRDLSDDLKNPHKTMALSIADTAAENPAAIANVRDPIAAALDIEMYPNDYDEFRAIWKINRHVKKVLGADQECSFKVVSKNVTCYGNQWPSTVTYKKGYTKFVMVRIQGTMSSGYNTTGPVNYIGYQAGCVDTICETKGVARVISFTASNRIGRIDLAGTALNLVDAADITGGHLFTSSNNATAISCRAEDTV